MNIQSPWTNGIQGFQCAAGSVAERQAQANVSTIKTAHDMLGTLIDIQV